MIVVIAVALTILIVCGYAQNIEILSPHFPASGLELVNIVFKWMPPITDFRAYGAVLSVNSNDYDIRDIVQWTSLHNGYVLGSLKLDGLQIGEYVIQIRIIGHGENEKFTSPSLSFTVVGYKNRILVANYGDSLSDNPSYNLDVNNYIQDNFANRPSNEKILITHSTFGLHPPLPEDANGIALSVLYDTLILRRYAINTEITILELLTGGIGTHYPTNFSAHRINDLYYLVKDKVGLEIGGPSYHQLLTSIYDSPACFDNVNYASSTLWQAFGDRENYLTAIPGLIYYAEATNLTGIVPSAYKNCLLRNDGESFCEDHKLYDFVFASHVLEHIVNPLLALEQMTNLLKPDGHIILILPDKSGTFDHKRPNTEFITLLEFYHTNRNESYVSDLLPDILLHYDLSRDSGAGTMEQFVQRSLDHVTNKALHVHVFDFDLIVKCLTFFHYEIVDMQLIDPFHQIVIARLVK